MSKGRNRRGLMILFRSVVGETDWGIDLLTLERPGEHR